MKDAPRSMKGDVWSLSQVNAGKTGAAVRRDDASPIIHPDETLPADTRRIHHSSARLGLAPGINTFVLVKIYSLLAI